MSSKTAMKIKFDPFQPHQVRAWESAIGVFEGQELCESPFSMPSIRKTGLLSNLTEYGFGNCLLLSDEALLENVRRVQLDNVLKQSTELSSRDFTIEMETGTGKTYVYLRSIFEMHRLYGFTKFIIVVPGVAIKEGVHKSLKMTESHFNELYDNVRFDYFVYDSSKLEQVRSFAASDCLQIMVINIDAFRKSFTDPAKESSANVIHRWNDRMQGVPIDFVRSTHPIVIIDEPQSVDTTDKSAEAIASLNPLCTFRYSATHVDRHHMLYKLDSIDAYEQRLVKQIEVAGIKVKDGHNKAYVKLLAVDNQNGHRAYIELDVQGKTGVDRKKKWVKRGQDLLAVSKGRSMYDGYVVNDIYCRKGEEYIDFTSKPEAIRLGQSIGDVNEDELKRLQIRKTIEEHLDKELRLTPQGVKVLSLFFIDRVANYRDYDAEGKPLKGKYARMFEEEYAKAIQKQKYHTLFEDVDTSSLPEAVHNGYFSQDKGRAKDSSGSTKADEDAYSLIMKDKEKLLSFDSKLKFIFSHSALKEGWDNPNVFQICTLNETQSILKKRQEIGRGLRLCVNQQGERVHGFEVNTLTVMANESYESFVEGLQKEIEQEEGIRFGVVERHLFSDLSFAGEADKGGRLGAEASERLWKHLLELKYIDDKGKVTDKLKLALQTGTVSLPEEFAALAEPVKAKLKKIAGSLNVKNNDDKRAVQLNKAVFEGPDFKELWDRIKYKTTYQVQFDPAKLIERCAESIQTSLIVGKTKFTYSSARAEITRGGIDLVNPNETHHVYDVQDFAIPDILGYLQNETNLKRQTIYEILLRSNRLKDFKSNPQKFIDEVRNIVKQVMQTFIVDGVKYQKIGDEHYYAQELFQQEELIGYLNKNMKQVDRSVYDHIIYDSEVEASLAASFEANKQVKVYAKLPSWFVIDTPLGSYNPDWAVLFELDGQERLYFVVESKGTYIEDMLRTAEQAKIKCGRGHFEALDTGVQYLVVSDSQTFIDQVPIV